MDEFKFIKQFFKLLDNSCKYLVYSESGRLYVTNVSPCIVETRDFPSNSVIHEIVMTEPCMNILLKFIPILKKKTILMYNTMSTIINKVVRDERGLINISDLKNYKSGDTIIKYNNLCVPYGFREVHDGIWVVYGQDSKGVQLTVKVNKINQTLIEVLNPASKKYLDFFIREFSYDKLKPVCELDSTSKPFMYVNIDGANIPYAKGVYSVTNTYLKYNSANKIYVFTDGSTTVNRIVSSFEDDNLNVVSLVFNNYYFNLNKEE